MAVFTAAATLGASILGAIGATTLASSFAFSAAVGFLAQAALGAALNALTPKPKTQGANRGYQVNTKGSALDHQIIYGRARTGGVIVYDETGEYFPDDEPDEVLFRVIAFAGHEIDSYDEFYLEGEEVTFNAIGDTVSDARAIQGSRWQGRVRIDDRALGTDNQTAFPRLVDAVSSWTSQHRLQGIAAIYLEMSFQPDVFPTGVPEFTATVKGKKVYDPREVSHDVNDPSTWEWSDNPALCIADYIRSGYGLSEDPANIDYALVETAADVCDEITSDGSKRYTCNGAFTTSVTPYDIMNDLLTSMGGLLWYAQGQWRMKAATYVAPTITFDEDDLRSSIAVKTRHSRRDNFNTVRGTFRGEESDWQVTDYPEVSNSAFLSADNGQESVLDLDLPFTDNSAEARRIARIALERNRQQLTVSASFGLRAFQVQVGDIIRLSLERFGWVEKEFEVNSWTFGLTEGQDIQVQMSLREISESVFDEVDDGVVYERDNTNLPDPTFVPAVGLSLASSFIVVYEGLRNVLDVTVTSSISTRVDSVEVQYKPSDSSDWIPTGRGELGEYRIPDLDVGDYDVRARAINSLGVRGEWEFRFGFRVDATQTTPSDVVGFTAEVNGPTIHLEWEPSTSLNLSHYKIRHSVEETGATYANATTAVDKVPRPGSSISLPARPGTYHIKAISKSGIGSTNYTSVVVPSEDLEDYVTTDTQVEDPTFSGTKSGVTVVSSALEILDTASLSEALLAATVGTEPEKTLFADTLIDGRPVGDINNSGTVTSGDSLEMLRYESGTQQNQNYIDYIVDVLIPYAEANYNPSSTATYDFSDYIDTGAVRRVRSRVEANVVRKDSGSGLFDDISGLFDDIPGLFDDATGAVQFADTNVKAYISTTQDDPAGTPTWTDYQLFRAGEYSGRAFRFRVILSSTSDNVTPSITGLKAIVEYD